MGKEKKPRSKRVCIIRNAQYHRLIPNRRNAEALLAHGYEVDIICLRGKGEKSKEVIHGMNVYRLPVQHRRRGFLRYAFEYSAFFFLAFWQLTWLSLRKRYDVIEVSGIPDFLVFTTIIPRLLGTAVVLLVLDHAPEVFMEHFKANQTHPMVRLLRWMEGTSARWSSHVISAGVISKQILESRGVPSSKISVVLNVPDEGIFQRNTAARKENGNFCLITHGSLLERYGVQTLIRAVPLLAKEIPNIRVKVVGGGEYQLQLEQLAQSLGVTKYVAFVGMVPQIEVPAHIAEADIGVVTIQTKTNPMLPNKLFEYMAMSKPAISTSMPAIRAYFDDSSVEYYEPDNEYDLASCVLELYRNPEKRAALAAGGQAAYQKYRWSTMKYEYLKVFDQLTKNRDRVVS